MASPSRLLRALAGLVAGVLALVVLGPLPAAAQAGNATISGTVTFTSRGVTSPADGMLYLWHRWGSEGEWVSTGANHWLGAGGSFSISAEPGEYKLVAVVDGAPRTFWGQAYDAQTAPSFTVSSGEHRTGTDIDVPAYGSVGGSVEIVSGEGAAPVPLERGWAFFWGLDPATGAYSGLVGGSANVSGGTYRWNDLVPGTYVVQVAEDDWADPLPHAAYHAGARYFEDAQRIVVEPGEDVELEPLVLQPREFDVSRVAGADRFATAVAASQTLFADGERAPVVYLANGYNFPDALTAGPAAIRQGGVILTTWTTALPAPVASELKRLDPERVVIVGSPGAVSTDVERQVRAMLPGADVDRLGGADRYQTAELIIRDVPVAEEREWRYALVATGTNFPDALAAAPAAAEYDAPVVLVPNAPVDSRLQQLIQDLGIDEVIIVGSEGVVSQTVADGLSAIPGVQEVRRVAGADRYETAVAINGAMLGYGDHAVVATGTGYADALAGAPLAGALGAPLYLSRPTCMPAVTMDAMGRDYASAIWLLGSPGALSQSVADLQPLC